MRPIYLGSLFLVLAAITCAQDAREIVRKSVELDQVNWLRMKDYTWIARSDERHFDSHGKITSEEKLEWETVLLEGRPYRRMLERNGKPLPPDQARKEEEKMDKSAARLEHETPEQRQHRLEQYEKERQKERAFLREVSDAYDFRLEGEARVDGQDTWVISGTPRPGFVAKSRDAKVLPKIRGKLWVDKTTYQWVRLDAETTDTISFGLFLAWLNPGAKLNFEQMRVNDEVWLPRRMFVKGNGRIGVLKRIALDQEITWNNYRKFHVESKLVGAAPQ
jgi:hypothetical protein